MNISDLEKYDYDLPEALIRKKGVEPRDSARLFVYDTKTDTITHDIFRNVGKYLPEHSILVLNDTRVVPARLHLKKSSGGKIEVFVLMNEWDGEEIIPVLVDRRCAVGWKLFFPNDDYFEVVRQEENKFFVRLVNHLEARPLGELLEEFGETPIPPYLEAENEWTDDEQVLRKRYQTIFAESGKSVAAPTAALHFTDEVFLELKKKNIDISYITLDVGLGTFAKLKEENFERKKLHQEKISLTKEVAKKINERKKNGEKIVAVGTTALRTLESCFKKGSLEGFSGNTDIFISPPHHFEIPDILITNFHIPKSSLMLLVDAFLQDKGAKRNLVELYKEAIKEKYAFYSFGDSMLII